MAFVVPDESTETAYDSIRKVGFAPCVQGLGCPFLNGYRRQPPAEHLHIDDELVISIYRKSDVLWEPSLSKGNPYLLNASDKRFPPAVPGRGQGRFPPEFDFVRILHPLRYCEVIIRLLCRDYDTRSATYWMAVLTYILEYVDETDIFNENSLEEAFRPFYHAPKASQPLASSNIRLTNRS